MKNTTKFIATDAHIKLAFTRSGIGDVEQIKELSGGWFNRIYSACSCIDGKSYVIKFAPQKNAPVLTHERNIMKSEVECYSLVANQTDIKIPQVIFSDFTNTIVPTDYFIMEFVDGVRLDKAKLSKADRDSVDDKMAWILSEFHKVKRDGYGYDRVGLKNDFKSALTHMTSMLIKDCSAHNKSCRIGEKLLSYIEIFASELDDVPSVLVNFDLNSLNAFYNKNEKGEIDIAVIDLERFYFGDPIGDFVIQNISKPMKGKSIVSLYNKYATDKINCDKNADIRLQLLCAYLSAIMYTERFSRFVGIGKYFNPVYIMGTVAYKFLQIQSLSRLKKYAK